MNNNIPTHSVNDLIGDNRYRIEYLISASHNSETYKALDTRLNVARAIKMVSQQTTKLTDENIDEFRERIKREIQLGATLDSEYIVKAHDYIEENERFYLVMDYMAGQSIRDRLDKDKFIPYLDAIKIAIEATRGLEVLHGKSYVHRDIKPSNILLNKEQQAKVADLGIVQDSKGGTTRTTKDKNRRPPHPGTQAYMSPEQAKEVGYVHPTSDIYSLGCTLFEMLTGVAYVNNKTRIALDDLPEQYPNVPKPLIPILKRMLAELPGDSIAYLDDPTRRYVNVGQVREALEALLTELTSEKTKFTLLTKPILAGITIAIVAVFFGGGLTVLLNGGYPTETPTIIALNGTETATITPSPSSTTPTNRSTVTPSPTVPLKIPLIEYFHKSTPQLDNSTMTTVDLSWSITGLTTNVELTGVPNFGPLMNLPNQFTIPVTIDRTTTFVLTAINNEYRTSQALQVKVEP